MRDVRLITIELGAAGIGATCAILLTSYAFPLPWDTSVAIAASSGYMFGEVARSQYQGVRLGRAALLGSFVVYATALMVSSWLS